MKILIVCFTNIIIVVNPLMLCGRFYHKSLDRSISNSRECLVSFSIKIFPVFNANSVDPDQMPCSAMSDLGLHCLPVYKWVNWHLVFLIFAFIRG